jgi:hypothetical protein
MGIPLAWSAYVGAGRPMFKGFNPICPPFRNGLNGASADRPVHA